MVASHTVQVVKYEPSDPRLGRNVEHDSRSKKFAYFGKAVLPKRVDAHWLSDAPPLNQGDLGSCTGNATAQWLNTNYAQSRLLNERQFTEKDAVRLYSEATHLDKVSGHYPPEDTGSTGNAAAKAAVNEKLIKSYSWTFSFSSCQAAIEKTPLSVGTLWTNIMFDPVNGLVTVGKLVESNIAGGHQYLMSGIEWNREVFVFRNSWGDQQDWPGCKPGGYFAIGFKDFQALLDNDGDVTVPRMT